MEHPAHEVVFVVRIRVSDEPEGGERVWRGSVYDVESGQRFYVSETQGIAEFIGTRLAERGGVRR